MSDWERVLYRALHAAGIRAIPQFTVERYDLDLAVIVGDRKLNIEVDGERYHRAWTGELCLRDPLRNQRLMRRCTSSRMATSGLNSSMSAHPQASDRCVGNAYIYRIRSDGPTVASCAKPQGCTGKERPSQYSARFSLPWLQEVICCHHQEEHS